MLGGEKFPLKAEGRLSKLLICLTWSESRMLLAESLTTVDGLGSSKFNDYATYRAETAAITGKRFLLPN